MSRHLERLLRIDVLLRNSERQTANDIAADLEVSERTVRADIEFLRSRYFAPIQWSKANGYQYTDQDWRLPTISLTQGELFALTLGARMLETYSGSAYAQDLQSAISRLGERLPEQTWVDLQQLADERIIFRGGGGIDLAPEIWHGLEDACRIYRGTNPYVIGFCRKRQAIRWFRVDRIRALQVLAEKFVRDPNFDVKAHLEQIFQAEVGGEPIEVAIWFDAVTAPYVRERRWHPSQMIMEHPDGAMTLRMTVRGINDCLNPLEPHSKP